MACGAEGSPDCIAQRLADEMDVEILAPTTTAYVDHNGKILVASDDEHDDIVEGKTKETDKWVKFYSGGRDE